LRSALTLLAAVLLLAGAWQSFQRTKVWENDVTLWNDTLKSHPDSPMAYYNRGRFYHVRGHLQEARSDYEKALELNPTHPGARKNLGVVFGMMGEFQKARECFDRVLEANPNDTEALQNRAVAYAKE